MRNMSMFLLCSRPCVVKTSERIIGDCTYLAPHCWVAQVSNLLYRRAASLRAVRVFTHSQAAGCPADWKSVIQQGSNPVGNLRYVKQRSVTCHRFVPVPYRRSIADLSITEAGAAVGAATGVAPGV